MDPAPPWKGAQQPSTFLSVSTVAWSNGRPSQQLLSSVLAGFLSIFSSTCSKREPLKIDKWYIIILTPTRENRKYQLIFIDSPPNSRRKMHCFFCCFTPAVRCYYRLVYRIKPHVLVHHIDAAARGKMNTVFGGMFKEFLRLNFLCS